MKRLLKLLILLVALVVAAAIGLTLFLDKGIKRAVELVGPRLTQVDVRLERVRLSLLSGRVELEGLFIGNPDGYQSESAIELGSLVLAAEPRSFISDKVVIRTLSLNAPVVTFEGGLKDNNLRQILDSVHTATERLRSGDPGILIMVSHGLLNRISLRRAILPQSPRSPQRPDRISPWRAWRLRERRRFRQAPPGVPWRPC
jgi:hypothetical protein